MPPFPGVESEALKSIQLIHWLTLLSVAYNSHALVSPVALERNCI